MRKFEFVTTNKREYDGEIASLPKRATQHSAGYDFYSPIDLTISPNGTAMVWTNIKVQFNTDEVLLLCVTSGMGKRGVMLCNSVGVIDCDYYNNESNDGNIGFRLFNFSQNTYNIKKGDKIGQGIFIKFLTVDNEDSIQTVRKGGFGSTDNKK